MSFMKKQLFKDDISNLKDLVTACILVLVQTPSDDSAKLVARILNFQVLNQIQILRDNLSEIKENQGDL